MLSFLAGVYLLGFSPLHASEPAAPYELRWTMINTTPAMTQAECNLIEFPDGTKVLIDVADAIDSPGRALAFLKKRQITQVDIVIISHVHKDHYDRLIDVINAGISVGRVVINLPGDREMADRERPWGADWDDIQSLLAFLRGKNIPIVHPQIGDVLFESSAGSVPSRLSVVSVYDGVNTPIGGTDVNDTSILVRLEHGTTSALFTGDLNTPMGAYLARSSADLAADILKVPHHGTEGLPPNEFFDRVNPKAALISSPRALWLGLESGPNRVRSKRTRDYFSQRRIPTYVTGINGSITVTMTGTGFSVQPERQGVF